MVHRGVRNLDPFSGLVVDLFCNGLFLWLFVLTFHDLSELWVGANLIFASSGLIVPGLFRLVAFKGIERLGASTATAVLNSAPLFAVLLAMAVLDEHYQFERTLKRDISSAIDFDNPAIPSLAAA